ncbi:DsbA family protein [Aliiroseovarius marinus]|uniref:DsbA family protein n=1 Tax=Aliiroseovarius marinus TaxID=2500159 RepID=UPI003D7C6DFD
MSFHLAPFVRKFALTAALALGTALPATALDLGNLSDEERSLFRDEVRAYLLDNPEVLIEAFEVYEMRQEMAQAELDVELVKANASDLFQDGYSHVEGNPDGDITIVEFVDYQCGYCRRAYDVVQELLEKDSGIRVILKEFPILSEASLLSARFAIAGQQLFGEEAYGKLHDALITIRGEVTVERLVELAGDLGLDGKAIVAEMASPAVSEVLQKNRELGQRLRITGTPAFVIQDSMERGFLELDVMEEIIAEKREGS